MLLRTLGAMFLFVPLSLMASPNPDGAGDSVISSTSSTSTTQSTTCVDSQCTTTTTSLNCIDGRCSVKTDGKSATVSETVTSDSSVVIDIIETDVPAAADDNS